MRLSAVEGMLAESRPEAGMTRLSPRWKRQVRYTPSARPSASNPGRRLALEAGTRSVNMLLNFQDVFLFGLDRGIDLSHVAVRYFLHFVERALFLVLGNLLVLEQLLDRLVAVAAYVAHAHAMVLGAGMQLLDQVLATLLGQGRNGQTDHLAVIRRVQPQIAGANGLLDRPDLGYIPGLDGDHARFGHVQVGDL